MISFPRFSWSILFFTLFLFQVGKSAEWSKLKKCSDLGFGRRQRHFKAAADIGYNLIKETISIKTWRGQSAITASLHADNRPSLLLIITAFASGIFRVVIDDETPPRHQRHFVKDIILDDIKTMKLDQSMLKVHDSHANLVTNDLAILRIHFSPIKVDIIRTNSEEVVLSLNAENRLLVEDFPEQPKPTPTPESNPKEDNTEEKSSDNNEENINEKEVKTEGEEIEGSSIKQEEDSKDSCDGCWEEVFQSHIDPKLRGPESVGMDISFPSAEQIYGLPERTVKFSIENTVDEEENAISEPYRMYNLDVFEFELDQPFGLYGAIPFIISRNKHSAAGSFWLNSAETYVDVRSGGKTPGKQTHWFSESGMIDTYLLPGPSVSDVYQQYMSLTGRPAMPQRFALGYHQCRWNYRDDEDARTVDAAFDEHQIPYDVLWLDIEHTNGKRYFTWDHERFPDPTALQNHVAARGRKMVTIVDPHIKKDNKYAVHRAGIEHNLYVTKPDGKPYEGWCWPGTSSYYDFTSLRVREAWANRFNPKDYPHFTKHLYIWNDMNEPSVFNGPESTMQKDMLHEGNVEHRHVHNIYGHYFMQATFEGVKKGHGNNDRPFVLSRSFFAGSQRYGAIWTGDNTASWEHLRSSIRMLLPLQISSMIFSGADVGGFFGNPSPELLTRWYQTGAFQPFFRGHAHLDTNRREPWLFGEPYTSHIADAIRTRYQYIPYWYTLFAANSLPSTHPFSSYNRGPPMRPMWWEFPSDKESDTNENQWMVGNGLLVAPVMEEGATSHSVYLPSGERWYDLYSPEGYGTEVKESGNVKFEVDLGRKVVLQRGGTIIVKQERRRRSTKAMEGDPYTIVVGLDGEGRGEGEMYMDDGKSYDHEEGKYVIRRFKYGEGKLEVETIGGGGERFSGSEALVERIVLLGYPSAPWRVLVDGKEVNFAFTEDSKVLTVQRVMFPCGKGSWIVEIH